MKKSSLIVLLVLPLAIGMASCTGGRGGRGETSGSSTSRNGTSHDPSRKFEVPVVEAEKLDEIVPPTMPTWDSTSEVKREDGLDIIDIYEVSDMHAMIEFNPTKGYWGFSGLANFFNEKRSENKGTIVVSSGDMWQGGSESNLTRGKIVVESMRYVGFEAMALGNHEFDWREEIIQRNGAYYASEMSLLCGNLVDSRTNQIPTYLKGSTIIERGGYKIGVIGTIGDISYSISKDAFENFSITSSSNYAEAEATRLRNDENCDAVIWLSHEDTPGATVPTNIDAFFGGHSHNDVTDTAVGIDHEIPKLATENYGVSIAHATLKIDPSTRKVAEATGELIKTNDHASMLVDEVNIRNLYNQYQSITDVVKRYELNNVYGAFKAEEELANLSCKAMYDTYHAQDDDIVASLQNGNGGVRTDISEGMCTYGDIYTAFPFDNEIVYFTLLGSKVRDFFESADKKLNIYVAYSKLGDFDKTKTYKVVTTDYVCTNVLKYSESKFTRYASTVIRDTVAEYIFNNSGLTASNFSEELPNYNAPTK